MHGCECSPPHSITIVNNYSLAASQIVTLVTTVPPGLILTLALAPGAGFFLLFLDRVLQDQDVNYTVDFVSGTVTLIGATVGQAVTCVYISAETVTP